MKDKTQFSELTPINLLFISRHRKQSRLTKKRTFTISTLILCYTTTTTTEIPNKTAAKTQNSKPTKFLISTAIATRFPATTTTTTAKLSNKTTLSLPIQSLTSSLLGILNIDLIIKSILQIALANRIGIKIESE